MALVKPISEVENSRTTLTRQSYFCSFQPDLNQMCHPHSNPKAKGFVDCSGAGVTWQKGPFPVNPGKGKGNSSRVPIPGRGPGSVGRLIGSSALRGPRDGKEPKEEPVSQDITGHQEQQSFTYTAWTTKTYSSKQTEYTPEQRGKISIKTTPLSLLGTDNSTSLPQTIISSLAPVLPAAELYTDFHCILHPSKLCNGITECLTDECGCGTDVFYCNDRVGCISHSNVCDGIQDCRDGSDECMCSDVMKCTFKDHTYCLPRKKYCYKRFKMYAECKPLYEVDCSDTGIEHEKDKVGPMFHCFDRFSLQTRQTNQTFHNSHIQTNTSELNFQFQRYCSDKCNPKWRHFCESMDSYNNILTLRCKPLGIDGVKETTPFVPLTKVCDGVLDCKGGGDEVNCPNRYYCAGTPNKWVENAKVCDHNKDCPRGDDECQNCFSKKKMINRFPKYNNTMLSSGNLVDNKMMRYYMVITSLLIILLNIFAGMEISQRKPESRSGKVDKILLLMIGFYDMLMGVCVGFTFVKSMIFSGSYCIHDSGWRGSLQCKLLGCFFAFSAHGSLFTVSLISLTRCYKCVFERTVRIYFIAILATLLFFLNAFHSVLPILPWSDVQDVFRVSMTFNNNPFIKEYNASEIVRIYREFKGQDTAIPSTYAMLKQLNTISSKPGIFDPVELGYYSYSPLCIQNFYGIQPSLFWYKTTYIVIICVLLQVVSISYIFIVHHTHR